MDGMDDNPMRIDYDKVATDKIETVQYVLTGIT